MASDASEREQFEALATRLDGLVRGDEVYLCSLGAEHSDFVRMNGAKIRQAGSVHQRSLHLDLVRGRRQSGATLSLSGDRELDDAMLRETVADLRTRLDELPDDPHILYATEAHSSERTAESELPPAADGVGAVLDAARGRDLVGIWASGAQYSGFANSLGQRNWHASHSFNLDWSFHLGADGQASDKAVKGGYAGTRFEAAEIEARFERAGEQLAALARPQRDVPPGRYRVYLAPAALFELFDILAWGGFGLQAHRTRTTPLIELAEGAARLAPGVGIRENTADGIAPDFQRQGFTRPERVELVTAGRHQDCLVSPRSAAEYGVETNGAESSESPLSIDVDGGELARDEVLEALGTGVYVSNLWYLNYSDRRACRTTGMTRFATFWVESGRIVAPLGVMRFDESLYRMLGDHLVGLTRERDTLLDPDTYGHRSHRSARLPGALVDDFHFAL